MKGTKMSNHHFPIFVSMILAISIPQSAEGFQFDSYSLPTFQNEIQLEPSEIPLRRFEAIVRCIEAKYSNPSLSFSITEQQMEIVHELKMAFYREYREVINQINSDPDVEVGMRFNELTDRMRLDAGKQIVLVNEAIGGQVPKLIQFMNRQKVASYGDFTGLTLEEIGQALSLSSIQKKELLALRKFLAQNTSQIENERKQTLKQLSDDHFHAILNSLTIEQRQQFSKWFGDVPLFPNFNNFEDLASAFESLIKHQGSGITTNSKVNQHNDPAITTGLPKKKMEIDFLLNMALTEPSSVKQLGLTDDQIEGINNIISNPDVELFIKFNGIQRLDSILKDSWELPKWLEHLLLEHQKEWLKEFEFQMCNLPFADSFGILNPSVKKTLKLTNLQDAKIAQLAERYRKNLDDQIKRFVNQMQKEQSEKKLKMIQVLDAKQREQYEFWFGNQGL
jgi:hypothetical protein